MSAGGLPAIECFSCSLHSGVYIFRVCICNRGQFLASCRIADFNGSLRCRLVPGIANKWREFAFVLVEPGLGKSGRFRGGAVGHGFKKGSDIHKMH